MPVAGQLPLHCATVVQSVEGNSPSEGDILDLETVRVFIMTRGIDLGTKVVGAIVLWIVGRWLIGLITGLLRKVLARNGRVDPTLAHYLGSILGALLNLLLILAILQVFGVQTTSFAALLAIGRSTSYLGMVVQLMIIGAIYDHEARKKSYSLLAEAFGTKKAAA